MATITGDKLLIGDGFTCASDTTIADIEEWDDGSGGDTIPTGFTNPDNGNLELITKFIYDDQGRRKKITERGGFDHYILYDDAFTMIFPYWDDTASGVTRPIQITERNDDGQVLHAFTLKTTEVVVDSYGVITGVSDIDDQNKTINFTHK